jgi:hypothetical protein
MDAARTESSQITLILEFMIALRRDRSTSPPCLVSRYTVFKGAKARLLGSDPLEIAMLVLISQCQCGIRFHADAVSGAEYSKSGISDAEYVEKMK